MLDFNKLDPERDEDPSETDWFIAAKNRVATLGVVLIVTAVLCGLSNFGGLVALRALTKEKAPAPPPKNMSPKEKDQFENGRSAAPLFDFLCVGAVSLVYLPVLLSGIALHSGSGRTLGLTAAVCAMLPCSPGFLIGLPVGIWALVVLSNEDVKQVLDHQQPEEEDDRDRRRRRRRYEDDSDEEDDRDRGHRRRR
ncbi:MAG TPA: hypothetical protein VGE74_15515 [Gemmata sp.]